MKPRRKITALTDHSISKDNVTQFSDGEQFYEQTRSRSNTIHLTLQINSESQKRLHLVLAHLILVVDHQRVRACHLP